MSSDQKKDKIIWNLWMQIFISTPSFKKMSRLLIISVTHLYLMKNKVKEHTGFHYLFTWLKYGCVL